MNGNNMIRIKEVSKYISILFRYKKDNKRVTSKSQHISTIKDAL